MITLIHDASCASYQKPTATAVHAACDCSLSKKPRMEYAHFAIWARDAKKRKMHVKMVTVTRSNRYYQAIDAKGRIAGFFNTGLHGGQLRGE